MLLTDPKKGDRIMADDNFNYDPEAEEKSKGTRLPFGLCRANGIQIKEWWTPKDAWDALRKGGVVDDVSEAYAEYFKKKKRERDKERRKKNRERDKRKAAQLADPAHNPDKNYTHVEGAIAGAQKGTPMSFEEADGGKCNPKIGKGIGYRHNCQTCVAVYYARRQGYDVRALPNLNNKNIFELSYNTSLAYVNEKGEHPHRRLKPYGTRTDRFLESQVKEGRIYTVEWAYGSSSNGHIITVERNAEGNLQLYDPQINEITTDVSRYFREARARDVKLMDLTGYSLDESFCDKIMKKE